MAVYFLKSLDDNAAEDPSTDSLVLLEVLVIDDQPANRLLVTQQLTFLGTRPSDCGDGHTGLQTWLGGAFDVVIMDCNMPGMNGYQVSRAIREHERRSGQPPCSILGYTAYSDRQVRHRCLAAGMDDCLLKPITLAAMRAQLVKVAARPPVMALQSLELLTGGDRELTRRLLEEVLKSCKADRLELQDEHQRQVIVDLAHKIKGAARIVRAEAVCRACDALDGTFDAVHLERRRIALCRALDDLHRELQRVLKKM